MLRATEQVAWSAKLIKFARGRPESIAPSINLACLPSRVVSSSSGAKIAWQHFSGHALCIRVLFSRPTDWDWPAVTKEFAATQAELLHTDDRSPSTNLNEDRHFSIAIEWERNDAEPPPSQRQSHKTAQSSQPVVLEELDVVRIHQAAHNAGHRDWAINAIHRDSLVGLRYRSEEQPELRFRCQLVFADEADKMIFLSLIQADCSIHDASSIKQDTGPLTAIGSMSDKALESQQASQSLSSRLTKINKASSRLVPKCLPTMCTKPYQHDSLPSSQGVRAEITSLEHGCSRLPKQVQATEGEESLQTVHEMSDALMADLSLFYQSPYALTLQSLVDDPSLNARISRCIDEVLLDPLDFLPESFGAD